MEAGIIYDETCVKIVAPIGYNVVLGDKRVDIFARYSHAMRHKINIWVKPLQAGAGAGNFGRADVLGIKQNLPL